MTAPTDEAERRAVPAAPVGAVGAGDGRGSSDPAVRVAVAAAVLACGFLLALLAAHLHRSATEPSPGRPAPRFSLRTFDDQVIEPASWRGRVVVVNFWASWCISCVNEAADLERVWRDYADRGVLVLGVAYSDTRPAARSYIERHGITYPCGMDAGGRVSAAYGLKGVPETVVIDADGLMAPLPLRDGSGPVAKLAGPIAMGGLFTPDDLRRTLDDLLEVAQR